ncbi:hypothetical protein HYZ76_01280 [Candidatus Falkowbacteria bacterium]|nr:hypothetical protein [Candidatus Falkowbacteria bacterium]
MAVPLSKRQSDYLIGRIHGLFRAAEIKIVLKKLNNGNTGETDHSVITIDPRGEVIATFIHECLHVLYPDWSEDKVIKTEDEIVQCLGHRQAKNLVRLIGDNL